MSKSLLQSGIVVWSSGPLGQLGCRIWRGLENQQTDRVAFRKRAVLEAAGSSEISD